MATRKKTKSNGSTALTKWDEEFAKQAAEAAEQEASVGGGQFFSLRGGTLSLNDAPIPNNEMAVVIVDGIMENVYYDTDYDPDNPASPACYAFGRSEGSIAPHSDVEDPVAEACAECPNNEWGSADTGRGKACRNRRRLALIPAGAFDRTRDFEAETDEEHFLKAPIAYLNLPPTSLNSYGAFVKQVASVLKRPPHGVFTKVTVVPDPKSQIKVTFEVLEPVPGDLISAVMQRHEEARTLIEFPYAKVEASQPSRGKTRRKTTKARGKKTSKRARY